MNNFDISFSGYSIELITAIDNELSETSYKEDFVFPWGEDSNRCVFVGYVNPSDIFTKIFPVLDGTLENENAVLLLKKLAEKDAIQGVDFDNLDNPVQFLFDQIEDWDENILGNEVSVVLLDNLDLLPIADGWNFEYIDSRGCSQDEYKKVVAIYPSGINSVKDAIHTVLWDIPIYTSVKYNGNIYIMYKYCGYSFPNTTEELAEEVVKVLNLPEETIREIETVLQGVDTINLYYDKL